MTQRSLTLLVLISALMAILCVSECFAGGWGCSTGGVRFFGKVEDFKHEAGNVSFLFSGMRTVDIRAPKSIREKQPSINLTQVPVAVGSTIFLTPGDMTWSLSFEEQPEKVKTFLVDHREFSVYIQGERIFKNSAGSITRIEGDKATIIAQRN